MPVPFRDRADAGQQLASHLRHYQDRPDVIVLGLPRGGIPVAAEVASANIRSNGAIKFETKGTHSSLANVVQTPEGVAA